MDKECRVSVEEERHDRESSARQKRIDALFIEKCAQYRAELTQGEIAEACEFIADADCGGRLVAAFHERDIEAVGAIFCGVISSWIALQAGKEVDRMIDRGGV